MSSTTPRVSLYKPAGGEDINVTTDLNNNLDKIDTNLNFRVVANAAARNAISPHWEGLSVRETDTGRCYVSNGTAPISGSWSEIVQANNTTVGEMLFGNLIRNTRATAADSGYETRVTGDTFARWYVQAGGTQYWGPGNATFDTNLYRSAANTLKTDDNLHVVQDLTVSGAAAITGDAQIDGDLIMGSGTTVMRNELSSTVTYSNTAAEQVLVSFTVPANDAVVGATYRICAVGIASCTGTPTFQFKGRFGGIGGNQFAQSKSSLNTMQGTNKCWRAEIFLTCMTTGASGTWFGQLFVSESMTNSGSNPNVTVNNHIDGSGTFVRDTTVDQDMVLTFTFGTANASNSVVCRAYQVERVC